MTRDDIFAALKDQDREAAVAGFMRAPIETLRPEAPLDAAVDRFYQQNLPALCVVDRDGVLVGVLGRQNLAETDDDQVDAARLAFRPSPRRPVDAVSETVATDASRHPYASEEKRRVGRRRSPGQGRSP